MTQTPPPMSQAPQGQYVPQAPKSNPIAIVSLICGIVGCLVITPIVGIITGIIGLSKAKVQGGKGMAIAGIILSILWIVGGIGVVGGGYGIYRFAESKVNEVAKQPTITFVNHLVDGDLAAASAMTDIKKEELKAVADYVKPLGKCKDITIGSPNWSSRNGIVTASFAGTAVFENATKNIKATVIVDNTGVKVNQIEIN